MSKVGCLRSSYCENHHPDKVKNQDCKLNTKRETLLKIPSPFPEIEGMDSLEKFNPPTFTMYDGKSNPRSHNSHYRHMMAL